LGNLSTPKSVQKLQTALHAKAKAEAGYRFYVLYFHDHGRRSWSPPENYSHVPLGVTKMNEDILLQKHQLGELKLIEWSRELIQRSDELLAQVIVGGVVGARLNLELIERSRELIQRSDELLAQVIMGDVSM
jgi:hypothetical protein